MSCIGPVELGGDELEAVMSESLGDGRVRQARKLVLTLHAADTA